MISCYSCLFSGLMKLAGLVAMGPLSCCVLPRFRARTWFYMKMPCCYYSILGCIGRHVWFIGIVLWHFSGGIRALRCVWRVWSKALTCIDISIWGCFQNLSNPRSSFRFVDGLRHANIIQRGAAPSEYGPCFETQIAGWSHGCSRLLGNFLWFHGCQAIPSGRCPGPMLRFLEAWQYHLEEAKLEVQPSQPLGEFLTVRMRDACWHFGRAVLPLKTLQRECQEHWCCKDSAAKYSNGM